jgi:elongation factor G
MLTKPQKLSGIRNVGIMAHIDAGKTTVTERILFYSGKTHRMGEVHEGQAIMDYMVQEREKGITITAAVTGFEWLGCEIHLIDTPGHVDFTLEVERCLRVLDGAVALFCGVGGVEPQSETVWYQADRYQVPRIAFVNKLDRVGADFFDVVGQIRKRFSVTAIPIQIPWGKESNFIGVIDLIEMHALRFDEEDRGSTITIEPIPADLALAADQAREELIEAVADLDDEVAMLYLDGEAIPSKLLRGVLRQATIELRAVPVLCGSGLRNKAVQPLVDAIVHFLPSPADLPPIRGTLPDHVTPAERRHDPNAPFSALAFKVQFPDGRRMVLLRIYSGRVTAGDRILNVSLGETERLSRLFLLHADKKKRIASAQAGMIVAAQGLKKTGTGDTISVPSHPILLEPIEAREPVISTAVEPDSIREKDKLFESLAKIADEDPTFHFQEDEETGELIMRGMGELHLEIVADRLKREFGVPVRVGRPDVILRETIRGRAEGSGRFFRETDDERIFGEVKVAVSPSQRGAGFLYEEALPEELANRSRRLLQPIREGIEDSMTGGMLRGDPIVDVSVRLLDITLEEGKEVVPLGYRIAAGMAVRNALQKAQPALLEPLMTIEIFAPEENLGDVIGDMSARGGQILDVSEAGSHKVIQATAPLRAMFGYSTQLRSVTQGRGTFSMEFSRFGMLS